MSSSNNNAPLPTDLPKGEQPSAVDGSNDNQAPVVKHMRQSKKDKKAADAGGAGKITIKTPKGTRDFSPKEMAIREKMFATITEVFKRHGGVAIDTPTFELREILAGKYGEDSKLIYDLQDQGGELCSLRYDLTVPFARFLAMHGTQHQQIKRYHIAKVFRRDQPSVSKGRMREFFQVDFDIAGTYEPMVPDAECLRTLCEALTELAVGPFLVKLNHRGILDSVFHVCGVPANLIRPTSSAVDKLDKMPWEQVKKEMVDEKGLSEEVADAIGKYVMLKGGRELVDALRKDEKFVAAPDGVKALDDMERLFEFLRVFELEDKISFDMSLARGLDYYTGVIYEAILLGEPTTAELREKAVDGGKDKKAKRAKPKTAPVGAADTDATVSANREDLEEEEDANVGLGSIAAGGRYDNLVGMFANAAAADKGGKKGKPAASTQIPCVGVSIGVERVFSILLRKHEQENQDATKALQNVKSVPTQVYVMSLGDGLLLERMQICKELWDSNIKAEFMYKAKPRTQSQYDVCDRDLIPLAIIIGRDEIEQGMVKIKDMRSKMEGAEKGGVSIKRQDMVAELKKRLADISL
ncbi:Cytoplasmic and mitochondrial histidine tRNA synthetase [Sorochytrium milnesiophthora]